MVLGFNAKIHIEEGVTGKSPNKISLIIDESSDIVIKNRNIDYTNITKGDVDIGLYDEQNYIVMAANEIISIGYTSLPEKSANLKRTKSFNWMKEGF